MEGVALHLAIILNRMEKLDAVDSVRIVGGGAKSAAWRQILADVFQKSIKTEAISEPDLRTKGMYEELRCILEEAYHALKNVNGKLSSLSAIQGKE